MATIYSSFTNKLITSNFSSIPIVFYPFFTWISLGGVDLCFSLMLVRKANNVEEKTARVA
jgi:hypothetical protein